MCWPRPTPDRRAHDAVPPHPHRRPHRRSSRSTVGAFSPTPPSTLPVAPTTSAGARRPARPPGPRSRSPSSGRSTPSSSPTTTTPTTSTTPECRSWRRCRRRHHDGPQRPASAPTVGGSAPWSTTHLEQTGRPSIEITATPCRHGPPAAGPSWVTSSASPSVGRPGTRRPVDLRRHGPLRRRAPVADRLEVGVALLHLGGARFPSPDRSATHDRHRRRRTVPPLHPHTAIPVHYEGWSHFRQGRTAIERAIAAAPPDTPTRFRLLPIGSSEDDRRSSGSTETETNAVGPKVVISREAL